MTEEIRAHLRRTNVLLFTLLIDLATKPPLRESISEETATEISAIYHENNRFMLPRE
jgi:hypothetical protein